MKSLNKVKSVAEIKQWLNSMSIPETAKLVITPKFDGVSWLRDEFTNKTYSRGEQIMKAKTVLNIII